MIKVTLGEKPKEEKPFPKYMEVTLSDNKYLILALNNNSVLHLTGRNAGTYIQNEWRMDSNCKDYNEPITTQNA